MPQIIKIVVKKLEILLFIKNNTIIINKTCYFNTFNLYNPLYYF